jgi:class 3 adenylate cyclase
LAGHFEIMAGEQYIPKPLDTSKVQLTDEIIRLTELFAANAHDVWAQQRTLEGWTYGPERNDEKKQHPSLIPYEQLPESEKEYDRKTALETVKTLISLGYKKDKVARESLVASDDLKQRAAEVINKLKNPKLTIAELRRIWEERLQLVWFQNEQVYRRAVDNALKLGEAFVAFDIAEEGLQAFPGDLRLIQLQALALARTGATRRANAILEQLRLSGHKDEETLGILARTHKDFWQLAADPDEKRKHLKTSYELYLEGYKRNTGYYTGINAASMGLIYGEREAAQGIAQEVVDMCLSKLAALGPESDEAYWLEATLAEAYLILGDMVKAEEYYKRGSTGGVSSVVLSRTRSQARLLSEYIAGNAHQMDHCFSLPRIAVFSGHMFDRPGRKNPRFPHAIEAEVRADIVKRLELVKAQVGYSSLACGGDIIFAEALLERGGEVNIVLPFKKDDFKKASVDIVDGKDWGRRFDHILNNAATVTVLSELGDANDGAAYDFCNQALSGLAILKSRFLGMDVVPIVVWDGKIGDGRGGTQSFVEYWQNKQKAHVEVVALADYLPAVQMTAEETKQAALPAVVAPAIVPSREVIATGQEIKAMIFTDIVGYTKLSEVQIPNFVHKFLGKVADLMERMERPAIHQNTWGDAVCAVFDRVEDAGNFALNMRDLVRGTDWSQYDLPELNIRIALNAGPVFTCYDPVLRKLTYNGAHVNRTARIEPIAEEGQIYASEAFAALSASEGISTFTCDYVGTKQLAKKYGAIPVFLVRRIA